MSISAGQYLAWLAKTNVERMLLAELHHADGIEYVATGPFMSLPSDADPNRPYIACIKKAVDITTRTDGNTTFGELTLIGDQLAADWHSLKWQGHPIKLFLGAPNWARDDFRLLAQGRNGGLQQAKRGALTLRMDDESSVLDEVIDTGQLPNGAGPVPLALGSVYNAPMHRVDNQTLTYRGSYLPVTSIVAKDNGNPVVHTTNAAGGTVELQAALVGKLTADIEEPHNTPQKIVEWVAAHYNLAISDIDLPPYRVGIFYKGEVTGREILNAVKEGLGAYWYLNELNELVIRQHKVPVTADVTIVRDDIFYDKLTLSETQQPWRSLTLRWGRNYSPLSTVAGVLDEEQPEEATRLRTEWRESHASQDVSDYPMAERVTRDSIIQDEADAITERDRLLGDRSTQRNTWNIEARFPPVFAGQGAAVDPGRLQGKLGRLINVSRSPTKGVTNLGVWV